MSQRGLAPAKRGWAGLVDFLLQRAHPHHERDGQNDHCPCAKRLGHMFRTTPPDLKRLLWTSHGWGAYDHRDKDCLISPGCSLTGRGRTSNRMSAKGFCCLLLAGALRCGQASEEGSGSSLSRAAGQPLFQSSQYQVPGLQQHLLDKQIL